MPPLRGVSVLSLKGRLHVRSNRPNNPTFVDLDFFGGNPSNIGNENQLSTSTEFICWEEVPLTSISADLVTSVIVANRNHRRAGSQSSDGRAQNHCNGSEELDPQSLRLGP
jgi:hypothetical protein